MPDQHPFSPSGAPVPSSGPVSAIKTDPPIGDDGPIDQPTVIKVPVPEGTVDLLDPAVIEREVERGKEENEAEYGHE